MEGETSSDHMGSEYGEMRRGRNSPESSRPLRGEVSVCDCGGGISKTVGVNVGCSEWLSNVKAVWADCAVGRKGIAKLTRRNAGNARSITHFRTFPPRD